jgi:hypothetical protein
MPHVWRAALAAFALSPYGQKIGFLAQENKPRKERWKMKLVKGQQIYYTGDMANLPGFGVVAAVRTSTRFGPESYDLSFEDGRRFLGVYGLMFDCGPGRRFWPLDEWKAERQKQIAECRPLAG